MSNYESVTKALAEGTDPGWRKSSLSVNGGNCVEAGTGPGAILVRDTADRGGPVLSVPAGAWAEFAAGIRAGRWMS